MRRLLALAIVLCACKKAPPPAPADASPPVVAEPAAVIPAKDAAAPEIPVSAGFELVAVAKRGSSKILSLQALGDHVWLSAIDLDAHADGDGPLAKGPDPLAKLPYDAKKHVVKVVGRWPKLFAMRTKNVNGRLESQEATVFVSAADGTWKQAKKLRRSEYPHAWVTWGDGALVVHSQIQYNATPYLSPEEGVGTSFEEILPDGTVTVPKIAIDPRFLAWEGSSDGTTLSLLGTVAPPNNEWGDPVSGPLVLARGTKDGLVKTTLVKKVALGIEGYMSRTVETGRGALAFIKSITVTDMWSPNTWTVLGTMGARTVPHTVDMCGIEDATAIGDEMWVARSCFGESDYEQLLFRVPAEGAATPVKLPSLARLEGGGFRAARPDDKTTFPCQPKELVRRGAEDLWIVAACGADHVPAVFRKGRPQEPVVLP